MADRTVSVLLEADAARYIATMKAAAAATRDLASAGRSRGGGGAAADMAATAAATNQMGAAAGKATTQVTGLNQAQAATAATSLRLAQAANRNIDATERVTAAEKALAAARKNGNADKIAAAETRLAKARRDQDIAARSMTVTQNRIAEAAEKNQNRIAEAAEKTATSLDRSGRVSRQSSLTFGQIALAAAAIGPAMIPIAGAAVAAGGALGGMGAAGVLALVGIKREMEAGTELGNRFAEQLGTADGVLSTLARTAAAGVLDGVAASVTDLTSRMPELNGLVGSLSGSLGGTLASSVSGLLNLISAAGPDLEGMARGVESVANKFQSWSAGSGPRELIEYMRTSMPGVGQMLMEVATAGGNLIQAFAPLGGTAVSALTALASAINALPLPVLTALIQVGVTGGAAFKAWGAISGVMDRVSGSMTRTGTAARTAGTASTAAGAGMTRYGAAASRAATGVTAVGAASSRAAGGITAAGAAATGAAASMTRYGAASTAASTGTGVFSRAADKAGRAGGRMSTGAKVGVAGLVAMGVGAATAGTRIDNFGLATEQITDRMSAAQAGAINLGEGFFQTQVAMSPDKAYSFADGLKQISGAGAGTTNTLSQVGTGLASLVGLGTGAGSQMEAVKTQIKGYGDELGNMVRSGNGAEAGRIFQQMATEANKAGVSTDKLRSMMPGYTSALQAQTAAQRNAAQAMSTHEGRLRAYSGAIEQLGGVNTRFGGSLLQAQGATTGFYGAILQANAAVKENGRTLNLNTAAGVQNRAALDGMAASAVKWGQDTFKATGSMSQANVALAKGRESYVQLATSMGMPREQAVQLANSLLKIPGVTSTEVRVEGLTNAYYDLDQMGQTVYRLANHPGVNIPLSAPNAAGVIKSLNDIDAKSVSANGRQVNIQVSAPLAASVRSQIDALNGVVVSADGKSITIDSTAPGAAATVAQVNTLVTRAEVANRTRININATSNAAKIGSDFESATTRARTLGSQRPRVNVSTNAGKIGSDFESATGRARTLGAQRPRVNTSTNAPLTGSALTRATSSAQILGRQRPNVTVSTNASSAAAQLRSAMNAAYNKSVTIAVHYRTYGNPSAAGGAARVGQEMYADGGIRLPQRVRSYAAGGVENHTAQIAPAGAWRVWAEPETGGEAYIPLAQSKRPRSMAILERTARMFGAQLVQRAQGAVDTHRDIRYYQYAQPAPAPVIVHAGGGGTDMSGLQSELAALRKQLAGMPAAVQRGTAEGVRGMTRSAQVTARTGR